MSLDDSVYPPSHHLLRDLSISVVHDEPGFARGLLPASPALLGAGGTIRLGALATFVDVVGGGLAAVAAAPDWMATSDLDLHLASAPDLSDVRATAHVLRRGSSTIVVEVQLETPDQRAIGFALLTFAVLARRDQNPAVDITSSRPHTSVPAGGAFEQPLVEAVGLGVVDAATGHVEMPLAPYALNSLGALQGGLIGLISEVAATSQLAARLGTHAIATDLHLAYLVLGRRGPVRTIAAIQELTESHGASEVRVTDTGADTLMAVARVRGQARP